MMMKKQLAIVAVMVLAIVQDASSEGPSYQLTDGFFKLPAGRKIGSTAGNLYTRLEATVPGTPIFLCRRIT